MTTGRLLRGSEHGDTGLFKALSLPDGPFKLYVWLRLHAHPNTGAIEISQLDLARALDKARGTIRKELKTLEQAGVCRAHFRRGPGAPGQIEIAGDYWPYERHDPSADDPGFRSYLDRIQAILRERGCIRRAFSAADRLLSRQWHARGVSLRSIECAVLLGCARKYSSWQNGAPRVPIASLAYFVPILAEVEQLNTPDDYWNYLRHRMGKMDKLWLQGNTPESGKGADAADKGQLVKV